MVIAILLNFLRCLILLIHILAFQTLLLHLNFAQCQNLYNLSCIFWLCFTFSNFFLSFTKNNQLRTIFLLNPFPFWWFFCIAKAIGCFDFFHITIRLFLLIFFICKVVTLGCSQFIKLYWIIGKMWQARKIAILLIC